jgi:5-oxoprolinase (ATP-hydrolysing)
MAAVLYVFRTLVDDDIPLNAGCLKPLKVIIPAGSMLNPNPPASVVAGNVETSTCITNALYGALGVMAASQCTMNNFTFGNARHQYYETISGGSGAGGKLDEAGKRVSGFDGTSVVQTHMTNSRLTDPEVLEFRFPVRLESYEIREGSGGAGRWHGGNGGVRRVRFLEAMTASILSNGRKHGAFGMAGGEPGQVGRNLVVRAKGRSRRWTTSARPTCNRAMCLRFTRPVAAASARYRTPPLRLTSCSLLPLAGGGACGLAKPVPRPLLVVVAATSRKRLVGVHRYR